ncbi:MAG: hypothetical protein ACP5JG_07165 [Anaerolineae bacterium]
MTTPQPAHPPPAWRATARSLTSALLFALAASILLQSIELGLIVTITLALHELGHILMLNRFGIDWEVRFGLFGAATVTPMEQRQQLDHYDNSLVHLAGPLANVTQALISCAVHGVAYVLTGGAPGTIWLRIANFAGLIALLNFLPLGHLSDGGKFAGRLFASLTESSESRLLWSLFVWLISLTWIVAVSWGDTARTITTLTVGVWYVGGMLIESRADNPADAQSPRAMTFRDGARLFALLGLGLLLSTALVLLTPFWLTRERALAIARAVAGLLEQVRALADHFFQ